MHRSAVTLGKIQAGIVITWDKDPSKAEQIEAWLDLVAQAYNVMPVDGAALRT